jgi:hypothetical protein
MPTEFEVAMLARNIISNKGPKDFRGDGQGELLPHFSRRVRSTLQVRDSEPPRLYAVRFQEQRDSKKLR